MQRQFESKGVSSGSARRAIKAGVVLSGLFFLAGCATLSKSECAEGDWRGIGFGDGRAGKEQTSMFAAHAKACQKHGVAPDMATYQAGYTEGVNEYCRPANGFSVGKAGNSYNDVCPTDLRDGFLVKYVDGLREKLDGLELAEDRLRDKLEDRRDIYEELVESEVTGEPLKSARKKVDEVKSELESNRSSQSNLQDLISKWSIGS